MKRSCRPDPAGFMICWKGKQTSISSVKDDKVILLIEGIRKSSLESRIVEWKELDKNE